MNLNERLGIMRQAFPACKTLAYADLSTKIILSWSASTPMPQEELNALCANAVEMLDGSASQHLTTLLGEPDYGTVYQVIVLESSYVVIFLRSLQSPIDALCCVCEPSIGIAAFIMGIRPQLDQIGADP